MKFKDVELLSAYLDGQISPSDSSRLESRLLTDPELASTLQALRESRGLLRRLPKRRAPRNFTLTPKMVGQKPPLPRSYPILRFATALAALLFVFSTAANQAARLSAFAPQAVHGIGGGGGDGNDAAQAPMMEAAPAATEAPATEPTMGMALVLTATPEAAADTGRAAKEPGDLLPAPTPAPFQIPTAWTIAFAVIALLGAASMFALQRLAAKKWRSK